MPTRPRPCRLSPTRCPAIGSPLKELEFIGHTQSGSIPERIGRLSEFVLQRLEQRYELDGQGVPIPQRVKKLRQQIVGQLKENRAGTVERKNYDADLDDVFLVVQLMSYPGNHVAERPNIERIAETLDKLEEDVIGVPLATRRGAVGATILFGEPIEIQRDASATRAVPELTRLLESRVQTLLLTIDTPTDGDWKRRLDGSNHAT